MIEEKNLIKIQISPDQDFFISFCRTREITAGDPNCSGDTSTLLPSMTESRDEIDVGELQSELLILLCPLIGQETDDVRTQIMNGSASAGNGSVNRQTV